MKKLVAFYFLFISYSSYSQTNTLKCEVWGCSTNFPEITNTAWYINSSMMEYGACGAPWDYPSIHVGVFENDSCVAWRTECAPYNNYYFHQVNGCFTCRSRPEGYFIFRTYDPVSMAYLDTMLTSPLLIGKNLLIYSMNCTDFDYLNSNYPNTVQIFQNLGFVNAPLIDSTLPFIYYAEVGDTSTAVEVYGQNSTDHIILEVAIQNCGSAVGISEDEKNKNVVYPTLLKNGENLHVEFDVLEIYDISGKLIFKNTINGNSIQINNLNPGMYLVRYTFSGKNYIRKIEVAN